MKLCTCALGDYPDALEGTGARWAAIVLTVFLCLWWLWEVYHEIRRLGISFLKSHLHKIWSNVCGQGNLDVPDFDQKVLRKFSSSRLGRYLWFLNVLRWVGAPSIFGVLGAVVVMSYFNNVELPRFIVERVLPEGLLVTFYGLYFGKFPHHFGLRMADALFAFLFLCLGAHTIFSTTTYQYLQISRLVYASQIMVAIAIGDTSRVVPLNAVSTLWQFLVVYITPALHEDWFDICIDMCTASMFTTSVSIFTETWLMAEARALVGEMEASRSEANVLNLLSLMCDAVVPLDPELKLRQHCPRLHAMLCRGAPLPDDTETPYFTKYLREDDIIRFEEFVHSAGQQGQASCIHVHLLDSMSNPVPVQLFHTSLPDNNSQQCHLIGIQEDRGRECDYFPVPPPPPLVRNGSSTDDRWVSTALMTDESISNISDGDASSVAASSVASGGDCLELVGNDEFFCSLETQLKMQVVTESPESRAIFDFSSAQSTEAFLGRFRNPEKILSWLRYVICSSGAGQPLKEIESFGTVRVINHAAGVDYKAELCATSFSLQEVSVQTLPSCDLQIHLLRPPPTQKPKQKRRRSKSSNWKFGRAVLGDVQPSPRFAKL